MNAEWEGQSDRGSKGDDEGQPNDQGPVTKDDRRLPYFFPNVLLCPKMSYYFGWTDVGHLSVSCDCLA